MTDGFNALMRWLPNLVRMEVIKRYDLFIERGTVRLTWPSGYQQDLDPPLGEGFQEWLWRAYRLREQEDPALQAERAQAALRDALQEPHEVRL